MTRAERLQAELAKLTLHERTQAVACVLAVLTEFLHGRRASERGTARRADERASVTAGELRDLIKTNRLQAAALKRSGRRPATLTGRDEKGV